MLCFLSRDGAVNSIDLWKLTPRSPSHFPSPFSHCSVFPAAVYFHTPSSSYSHAFSRVNTFLPACLLPLFCFTSVFSSCLRLFNPPSGFSSSLLILPIALYLCPSLSFFSHPLPISLIHSRFTTKPTPTPPHPSATLSASNVGYLRGDRLVRLFYSHSPNLFLFSFTAFLFTPVCIFCSILFSSLFLLLATSRHH